MKGAEPLRGSSGRGSCASTRKKHKGVTGHLYQDNPNSTRNRHRRSRAANLSQPGVELQKGSQLHDTERLNRHTKGVPARACVTPRRRRRRNSTAATERKTTNTKTGTTRESGLQLKPLRPATLGEREREREEKRQAEQKRQYQK